MTNDLLQIICHFNLHLKGFRCFYRLIYVQYTICNHLFEKVKKSVPSLFLSFLPFSVHVFFPPVYHVPVSYNLALHGYI